MVGLVMALVVLVTGVLWTVLVMALVVLVTGVLWTVLWTGSVLGYQITKIATLATATVKIPARNHHVLNFDSYIGFVFTINYRLNKYKS